METFLIACLLLVLLVRWIYLRDRLETIEARIDSLAMLVARPEAAPGRVARPVAAPPPPPHLHRLIQFPSLSPRSVRLRFPRLAAPPTPAEPAEPASSYFGTAACSAHAAGSSPHRDRGPARSGRHCSAEAG
jgi:hypothetical protein